MGVAFVFKPVSVLTTSLCATLPFFVNTLPPYLSLPFSLLLPLSLPTPHLLSSFLPPSSSHSLSPPLPLTLPPSLSLLLPLPLSLRSSLSHSHPPPFLPGSHLPLDSPALEFTNSVTHVLGLDPTLTHEVTSLKRLLLAQVIIDFNQK